MLTRANFICICLILLSCHAYSNNIINDPVRPGIYKKLSIGDKIPSPVWQKLKIKKSTELVILDFWLTSCTSCIEAFPKMEKLQNQFPGKLQVILVNSYENSTEIEKNVNVVNARIIKYGGRPLDISTSLKTINGDTIYNRLFPLITVPHHVWINGNGIVLAITNNYNATPEHVQAILNGKKINMLEKDDYFVSEQLKKGHIQLNQKTVSPAYYSAFIPFSFKSFVSVQSSDTADKFRMTLINHSVIDYFMTAFSEETGIRPRVILELKNKDKFLWPKTNDNLIDDFYRNYTFDYEIQCPLKDKDNWKKRMQFDANYFFGSLFGIEAKMETREFNTLSLIKTNDKILNSTGKQKTINQNDTLFNIVNYPFYGLVNLLTQKNENVDEGQLFFNKTGIDPEGRVDILLTGNLKDVDNIKKQLQLYGLDLIPGKEKQAVLVIKNKDQ